MSHVPVTRKALALMCLAAAAVMAAGCGSTPKPRRTYGNVIDYERMTDHYDPTVSLVYSSGTHTLDEYHTLYIADFEAEKSDLVESYKDARHRGLQLRYTIIDELRERDDTFRTITADDRYASSQDPGVLVMKPKITIYRTGSGWKRYFFIPSGASDFQIECRLVDAATGETVMVLADRRRFLGNTPWGPNPDTFNDKFVMNLTLKETAVCLADFLTNAYHGLPGPRRASSEG